MRMSGRENVNVHMSENVNAGGIILNTICSRTEAVDIPAPVQIIMYLDCAKMESNVEIFCSKRSGESLMLIRCL